MSILKIIGAIAPWFSPDRVDKRHRKKIGKLEDELEKLIKDPATDRNRKRAYAIQSDLSRLRKDLIS